MAHDVFVSYSSKDKPIADAVVAGLENNSIRCWIAPRDIIPGKSWGEAINSAIEGSTYMVIILSGNSNRSNQVVREVERAVANDVIIIPFRIEKIDPTGAMAYFLSTEHWLDAMTPPLEEHIEKLAHTIQIFQNGEVPEPLELAKPLAAKVQKKFQFQRFWPIFAIILVAGLAIFLIPRLINRETPVEDGLLSSQSTTQAETQMGLPTSTITPTLSPTPLPTFKRLGSWSTSREARNVFVRDEFAYIANGEGGLILLDISDPNNPEEVSKVDLNNVQNVIVEDQIAYVAEQGQLEDNKLMNDKLIIINFENPADPQILGTYEPEGALAYQTLNNMAIDDKTIYLGLSDRVIAVDVDDPSQPETLGEFSFSSNISSPGVAVSDGIVYLQANRLHVVDFSDPFEPVEIGGFDSGWGSSIKVMDQKAFIASWDAGLIILDVSNPANPVKLGEFMEIVGNFNLIPTGAASRQIFLDLAISNARAYLTFSFGLNQGTWTQVLESGIVTINISDPANPSKINTTSDFDEVSSIATADDLVFVTDTTRGLFLLQAP